MQMNFFDPLQVEFWSTVGVAVCCGAIVGFERQLRGKPSGIRTSILVCMGTTLFVKLGILISADGGDPTRVLSQIISGIGFLGAGVMFKYGGTVLGVTTASVIWTLAAIGAVVGFGYFKGAIALSLLVVTLLTGIDILETSVGWFACGVHYRRKKVKKKVDDTVPHMKSSEFDKGVKMIKAYIFDMDGVLCDSEWFIAEAASLMFKTVYGLTVHHSDFKPFIGTGEDRFIGGVAKKYGVSLTMPRDKETTYQLYADCVKDNLRSLPGVVEFIRDSAAKGLKLAVATSADRFKMDVNLESIGLDVEIFDALITGNDIKHKKPAPDIFLKAAQKLGVDPAECVVFEDAVTGVQAAKAAGCRCVGVTTSFSDGILKEAGADVTIVDFIGFSFAPRSL